MLQSENIKRHFTKRYLLAIGIIALLSSIAFFTLHFSLKVSDSTALIVNISGKQRMLSQRIASLSQHYYSHVKKEDVNDIKRIKISLQQAILEMNEANEKLSSGRLAPNVTVTLSETIHNIYFGNLSLKSRVDDYLRLANQVTATASQDELYHLTHEIALQSEDLLPDLHQAVMAYQKEGEENIDWITSIETFAYILTLFALMLEVIFIFQPMAHKINELIQELLWKEEHLEHEIEMRTLSLEQSNDRLLQLASHDPLTGLKNRLNLEQDIEEILVNFEKHRSPYAVLMIDIDWFKKINDNFGHDAGDYILKEFARTITSHIRVQDSVYRAGGEEFVIIFNRLNKEQAVEKAEEIRKTFEAAEFIYNHENIHFTVSGGLYHPSILKAESVQGVLKLADNALYEAKRNGRNQIVQAVFETIDLTRPIPRATTSMKYYSHGWERIDFIDHDITDIIEYDYSELVSGMVGLKDMIHPDDHDVITRLTKEQRFSQTLRLMTKAGKVKIVWGEFYPEGEGVWLIRIQDVRSFFEKTNDKTIVHYFNAMLANSDDFIYFKDAHHLFTGASQTLVNITSADTPEEMIGLSDYELFSQELSDQYFILEKEVFSGNVSVSHDVQPFVRNDGTTGLVDNRKYPIKNDAGEIIGLFGIARIVKGS